MKNAAAIRYELGDSHTYEFIEGTIPTPMALEFANVASSTDEFFAYADFDDLASCLKALNQLEVYVASEGPFDGLLAFSQGATISATYLAHAQRRGVTVPFKCAIFFSTGGVFDVDLLAKGEISMLTPEDVGEVIQIPTAHIWGLNDSTVRSAAVAAVCAREKRQVFVHDGAHEIPGVRSPADVKSSVRVMRRVISMVS
ncbi:Family of serine hydrolases 3 [Madurella mycetomatis]|uniref:Family of serine hydrolases 3 n=1 Tax=Madurella mycetomatis TaxID=100816 RepID=A0A175VW08_9PEZI|nr:Family of serine hydrolases 3 [Madurella mycetomatis]